MFATWIFDFCFVLCHTVGKLHAIFWTVQVHADSVQNLCKDYQSDRLYRYILVSFLIYKSVQLCIVHPCFLLFSFLLVLSTWSWLHERKESTEEGAQLDNNVTTSSQIKRGSASSFCPNYFIHTTQRTSR